MRALVFPGPGSAAFAEVPLPEPGPGEVRVRVAVAGLCAGDLYIYTGKNPYVRYPRIGCHEIAGVVEAAGPDCAAEPGLRVVVEPFIGCGHCYPCRVGKPNCCANLRIVGVHQDGGFADFVIVPASHVHPVPAGMALVDAAFAEPVAIGVQGCNRAGVTAADHVLVLGAGPIGLAVAEVARARGARVHITDLNIERLAVAGALGIEMLAPGDDLPDRVLTLTNGEGMPVVMEATGAPPAMQAACAMVAAGGRVVILGLVARGVEVCLPGLDFTRKEMTILGSRASTGCFPEALALIARGHIRYLSVATRLPFSAAAETFPALAGNPFLHHKVLFEMETP
jgi:L-gulonate 5-dehydrogenase